MKSDHSGAQVFSFPDEDLVVELGPVEFVIPKLTPEQVKAIRWPSEEESEEACYEFLRKYRCDTTSLTHAECTCFEVGWDYCLDWAIRYALQDLLPEEK